MSIFQRRTKQILQFRNDSILICSHYICTLRIILHTHITHTLHYTHMLYGGVCTECKNEGLEIEMVCIKARRRQWHPTLVLLPGKSHERRSLVGCSPWGHFESDMTEGLHFHFSLPHTGEGNGNPLQCSCLENPRDGGAWWAAVYGVTQGRTQLKRLSSSSIKARSI